MSQRCYIYLGLWCHRTPVRSRAGCRPSSGSCPGGGPWTPWGSVPLMTTPTMTLQSRPSPWCSLLTENCTAYINRRQYGNQFNWFCYYLVFHMQVILHFLFMLLLFFFFAKNIKYIAGFTVVNWIFVCHKTYYNKTSKNRFDCVSNA